MGSLKFVAIALLAGLLGSPAFAQSAPTHGLGRTPSAEEIRARDINIGPRGMNFLRVAAPPRKAKRSLHSRGASSAMAQKARAGGRRPR